MGDIWDISQFRGFIRNMRAEQREEASS